MLAVRTMAGCRPEDWKSARASRLVMTPQLQQAIKLLQLSNVELAEYCEQELEKNPLLERDDEPAPISEREQPQAETSNPKPLDTALAREDFSKCRGSGYRAQDNLYDGDDAAAGSLAGQRAPEPTGRPSSPATPSKVTKIFWNPRSRAAARSRII